MNFFGTFRVAVRALQRNPLRSFLTMLGVIIGILSVVAMLAIGSGARTELAKQFAALGTNVLFVVPGATTSGGASGGMGSVSTLTVDDVAAIEKDCAAVKRAAGLLRSAGMITVDGKNWSAPVYGTTPGYFEVRDWPMQSGRAYNDADYDSGNAVCVIGNTVKENLFGESDPIDPEDPPVITVKGMPCKVIGLLSLKGQAGFGGDQDDVVLMPMSTLRQRIMGAGGGAGNIVSTVMVTATSSDDTGAAQEQMKSLLRQRHHIREGEGEDFVVRDMKEVAESAQKGIGIISALLGGIALVSLVVGGIGIMNIMLVSVTERTREIGIRMALGARGSDVLAQFLVESIVLALLGGVLGVAGGVGVAHLVAGYVKVPPDVSLRVITIAFLSSSAVGLFFGFYPARRASQLDPIEALRYE